MDVLNEKVYRMCWWDGFGHTLIKALNSPFASRPHFWQIPLSRLNTCARTLVDAYIPVDTMLNIWYDTNDKMNEDVELTTST